MDMCHVAVSAFDAVSPKCFNIGRKLLLITNRKSHTRFRLVGYRKQWPFDDLERPLCILYSCSS